MDEKIATTIYSGYRKTKLPDLVEAPLTLKSLGEHNMTKKSPSSSATIDADSELNHFTVVKRNGSLVPFRKKRIYHAIEAAFRDTKQMPKNESLPEDLVQVVKETTEAILQKLGQFAAKGTCLTVEGIQDVVEVTLMDQGHHDVARDYIIYRDKHKQLREDSPQNLKVLRKDGTKARFNPMKVASTLEVAFRKKYLIEGPSTQEIIDSVNLVTQKVVARISHLHKEGVELTTALVQDEVENQLMREGFFNVAKEMILRQAGVFPVREEQSKEEELDPNARKFTVFTEAGISKTITDKQLRKRIVHACRGLEKEVSAKDLLDLCILNFYEGIKEKEVDQALIMATRAQIEKDPAYSKVASRLLLDVLYRESMEVSASDSKLKNRHKEYFKSYIKHGISIDRLSSELEKFDLDKLADAMDLERDDRFYLLGLQNLYDRYFIHDNERRLETPQIFWMRVAMGLSINEDKKKNERAIEFYHILSQFLYTSATPTLFNSGTCTSQLSSCFLSTVMDDLEHIFKIVSDDAKLSKWAGGLGNDWTNVRATGARIKGTNGRSQGVIPFLKVVNDTAVAVNQGGKRKGALCCYLETWHLDLEDFLELRKNTGDERRRTHDMHTANWIPDLFMKRVNDNGMWTLFNPSDVPDLHDLYGQAFEKRYVEYEKMADEGKIILFKRLEALPLWRKMLSMLFETGHPWITFKDPSNVRSTQDHVGVVHSSNLCTEILLNTSREETAVCNLGSINLAAHMTKEGLNKKQLAITIKTAVRMLDNVIDLNFYPIPETRNANAKHRPIGLGIMGFQDALYIQNISYSSHEAVEFADESMEFISYHAILASSELAKERGIYESYKGSKWDRGLFPIDTIALLAKERGQEIEMDTSVKMDWTPVRESVKKHGMRNSNTLAIAPTATISNITGVTQSIEPTYRHLFVKSNLSGEFILLNVFLVHKLKEIGLWDEQMIDDLKYFDGMINEIERIPDDIKQMFPTAFEIDPEWIIECASRRQKWIDMGQSLNLYLAEPSGKKIHQMYMMSWNKGIKTNYYLRTLAATQIEKSTTDINKRGLQPRWMKNKSASDSIEIEREEEDKPLVCDLEEGCESCQ
ncbi:MAG: Ribonucleoside-diphosphate reductase 1 subunit alpha [Chlamydiae bacterium]|nr:Ribonucleoside-diphosphate reductase 1 subunit alpha [Chlamydiota bacterium]